MARSEKRDLRGISVILHDERLKKPQARGDGVEEKSKWGILTPTSYSSPVFPHSLQVTFLVWNPVIDWSSNDFFILLVRIFFSTTVFCHNLVTTKHVATNTLILRSIELRAGVAVNSGGSGGRRKRVEASSCRSARVCRLFFDNLYLSK